MAVKILYSEKFGYQEIFIDDEDLETYNKYKWYMWSTPRHSSTYVITAGTKEDGYTSQRLHRYLMKALPGQIVDHVNGNCLDNRRQNLRITDSGGNNKNARKRKNAVGSIYKGVSQVKRAKKGIMWLVQIQCNKKHQQFGPFETEIEAAKVYNAKALELFGEFAKLNIIPE